MHSIVNRSVDAQREQAKKVSHWKKYFLRRIATRSVWIGRDPSGKKPAQALLALGRLFELVSEQTHHLMQAVIPLHL